MTFMKFIKKYYYIFLLLVVVGVFSINSSPLFKPVPHRDSGIFLYIGNQILKGDTLYLDLWNHRGPIVFFINAVGVLLTPQSVLGIWIIETTTIFLASIFSYKFFENLYGKLPAIVTTILWLNFFTLIHTPNFSENYYILIQFILLYLFQKAESSDKSWKYDIGIGIVGAVGFLIRANMVGITIVIILIWLWKMLVIKEHKKYIRSFLYSGIGAFAVLAFFSIYFLIKGAFSSFIDQAFLFNFNFFGGENLKFIASLEFANNMIGFALPLAIAGLFVSIIFLFIKNISVLKMNKTILALSIIYFPLEIYFVGLSGEKYVHYLIPLFAGIALLSGFVFSLLYEQFSKTTIWKTKLQINQIVIIGLFIGFISTSFIEHAYYAKRAAYWCLKKQHLCEISYSDETEEVLDFIAMNTDQDDYVYFWGIDLNYNFLSDRKSLGKFWNSKVFIFDDYLESGILADFKEEILDKKPMIIDSSPEYDYLAPLFGGDTGVTGVDQVMRFIMENYSLIGEFESNGWLIYKFVD